MPGSTGSEVITGGSATVKTEAIRTAAESGAARVAAIDQLIEEMQQDMAASEASWMGDAGSWYRDAFVTGSSKCRKALEEYGLFSREMVSYADEYEAVDSRAQGIADSVEQPEV